jgi:hypothetical protein
MIGLRTKGAGIRWAASAVFSRSAGCSSLAAPEQEMAMALGDEIDEVIRREVKSLPAYAKAQAAGGSGVAPPVEEMNQLLMGLVVGVQRSLHLLADRIEDVENRST